MAGRKAIKRAVRSETTHTVHTMLQAHITNNGGMVVVNTLVASTFLYGLEVGLRIAQAEMIAARRLTAFLDHEFAERRDELGFPEDTPQPAVAAAERLTKVLGPVVD